MRGPAVKSNIIMTIHVSTINMFRVHYTILHPLVQDTHCVYCHT